eukprot:UC1_evm2s1909
MARVDPEKPNPRLGVGWMSWSHDSKYLATRNDNAPRVLWVWDVARLRLCAVLEHRESLRDATWHPVENKLALSTGGAQIFFWSKDGSSCVKVPTEAPFSCTTLQWSPDGSSLILRDRDSFCVASAVVSAPDLISETAAAASSAATAS